MLSPSHNVSSRTGTKEVATLSQFNRAGQEHHFGSQVDDTSVNDQQGF